VGEIPKAIWNNFAAKYKREDAAFVLVARSLAVEAQSYFNDSLSFKPSTDQFFKYERETFTSSFEMSARKGNNGQIYVSAFVGYKPKE
jgi:hypothetical protein